eukprot:EST47223.1 Hypothetical protein SS50377_12734 [Spironucleus salmonicida]
MQRTVSTPLLQFIPNRPINFKQLVPKDISNLCQKCQINLQKIFSEYDHFIYILQTKHTQNISSPNQQQIYNNQMETPVKRPIQQVCSNASLIYQKIIEKQKIEIKELKSMEYKMKQDIRSRFNQEQGYLKQQLLTNFEAIDKLNKDIEHLEKAVTISNNKNQVLLLEKQEFVQIKYKFEIQIDQMFKLLEEKTKSNQCFQQKNIKLCQTNQFFDGLQQKYRESEDQIFQLNLELQKYQIINTKLTDIQEQLNSQLANQQYEIDKITVNLKIKQSHIENLEEQIALLQIRQDSQNLAESFKNSNQSFSEIPDTITNFQGLMNQSFDCFGMNINVDNDESMFVQQYGNYQNLQHNIDIYTNIVKQQFKKEYQQIQQLAFSVQYLQDFSIGIPIIEKARQGNKDYKKAIGSYLILTQKISQIKISSSVFNDNQLKDTLLMIYDGWEVGGMRGIVYLKKEGVCKYV